MATFRDIEDENTRRDLRIRLTEEQKNFRFDIPSGLSPEEESELKEEQRREQKEFEQTLIDSVVDDDRSARRRVLAEMHDELVYDFTGDRLREENPSMVSDIDDPAVVKFLVQDYGLTGRVKVTLLDKSTGHELKSAEYDVGRGNWYRRQNGVEDWFEEYDSRLTIFRENTEDDSGSNLRLIFTREDPLQPVLAEQSFAAGRYHCLLGPIKDAAVVKYEESSSRSTKGAYKTMLKKLDKYLGLYVLGIPEGKMQELVDDLKIDVYIMDVMTLVTRGKIYKHYKSHIRRRMIFKFINTQLDHVESTQCYLNTYHQAIEIKEQAEMERIVRQLEEGKCHYLYKHDRDVGYKSIHTRNKYYLLRSEYRDVVNDFEKENGLDKCSLYVDDPSTKFALHGCHIGKRVEFNDCVDEVIHVDHKASYASYKDCEYYEGFPTLYSRWRFVTTDDPYSFIKQRPGGLFYVENFDYSKLKENDRLILDRMHSYHDGVFPGPELRYLWDIGVRFELLCALWGKSTTSFDMPNTMFQEEDGLKHYKRWGGMCMTVCDKASYKMRCDRKMAEHMKALGYTVYMYQDERICTFTVKRPEHLVRTKCHIAAYLFSYSRIQVMQQLLQFRYEDLVMLCLDDIYVRKHNFVMRKGYRKKICKEYTPMLGDQDGISYELNVPLDLPEADDKDRGLGSIHVITGGPGTGKTYTACKDTLWRNVLYSAPSHKLRAYIEKTYNIRTSVHANLTGPGEVNTELRTAYSSLRIPSVIIIDEATQMSKSGLEKVETMFPNTELVLLGDYDCDRSFCYQLNPVDGEPIDIRKYDRVELSHNYRADGCNRLASVVNKMRSSMKRLYSTDVYRQKTDPNKQMGELIFSNHVKRIQKFYEMSETDIRDALGSTTTELSTHISDQWYDEKMSWKNYGSYWNVDHIIPVSIGENKSSVSSYSNLQPLTVEENVQKGNKGRTRRNGGFSKRAEREFVQTVTELLRDKIIHPKDADVGLEDYVLVGRKRCGKCKMGVGGVSRCKSCQKKNKYCKLCKLCRCEAVTRVGKYSGVSYWASELANKYRGVMYNGVIGDYRKYLIVKKGNDRRSGDICIQEEQPRGSEERYAFTVHQTQGETIESDIYVDMDNLFDPCRMLYTAISRAKTISQIHLVKNDG